MVDDVLGVVADGDELETLVVAQVELMLQLVTQLGEEQGIIVDAEGEAEGGVLHEVDTDVETREDGKDGLEVVFGNEAEVFGQDGEKGLVALEDVEGCEGTDGGEGTDDGAWGMGVEERADVKLDIFVLDGFDGFGVDDAGTVVGQFDGFVVGDLLYFDCVGEVFGVRVEESGDVFPDGHAFGIEAVGQDGGAVVAAFAAEGGGVAIGAASNEALGDDDGVLGNGQDEAVGVALGGSKVNDAFAVLVVGGYDLADIYPLVCETDGVEEVTDDGGGDKFTETDGLAVVEIVGGGCEGALLLKLGKEAVQISVDGMGGVGEEVADDGEVVLAVLVEEGRMVSHGTHARHQLLEEVGGFAHGGYDDHKGTVVLVSHDGSHVAHGCGTVDGGSSEFEYFHRCWRGVSGLAKLTLEVAAGVFFFDAFAFVVEFLATR